MFQRQIKVPNSSEEVCSRSELVKWINDRLIPCTNQSKNVLDRALRDFSDFKQVDPLSTWFKQTSESTSRMLDRIQNLAKEMASMVKYSFLVEPGSITPHLSVRTRCCSLFGT
ncbi:unnamed protein product [Anisakis simplex]|uniref:Uncharacterized protein n=1 Tax=Anisakis simplex TaxID=6269 RepID=A0A0M3JF05_ANISI|nr:unnamed protein product [Anisakis simplex]